jgi:hypothetical protein
MLKKVAFIACGVLASSSVLAQNHTVRSSCTQNANLLLPAPLVSDPSNLMRFLKRDTALYLAEVFSPGIDLSLVTETQTQISLGCAESLTPEVRKFLADLSQSPAAIDTWASRQQIGSLYQSSRLKRVAGFEFPLTLEEFSEKTQFPTWDGQLLVESRAKGYTRKLFHSPQTYSPKISVAQTHTTRDGNLNTPIRETEIMIERTPGSNQWDFIIYDSNGKLAIESEFPRESILPSPAVCMTCHYEPSTRTFGTFMRPGSDP